MMLFIVTSANISQLYLWFGLNQRRMCVRPEVSVFCTCLICIWRRMWNLTNSSEHSVVIYNAHISLMWLCKSYPSLRTLLRAESYKTQQGDLPSLVRTPCSEWTMNSCISKVKPCPACTQSQTYQARQKENIEKQVFTASKIKSRARTYKMNCTSEKSVSNIIIYVKCKYCTERFHGPRY